jgi:hypothetical protein
VVNRAQAPAAQGALADALGRTGRKRAEIALVGRVAVTAAEASADNVAAELDEWATSMGLDGLELRPPDGRAGALTVAHNVLPRLQSSAGASLRAALGLPELTGART